MKLTSLLAFALLLTSCVPSQEPLLPRATAVTTEQPVPNSNYLATAYPYPPPPQPTSPYPGPRPITHPTRLQPTSTPPITTQLVDNCDLHPSFSRCGGIPLTGKLAYFQIDGRLTVLNFDTETAWVSTQINLKDVDWSPAGDRLLVHDKDLHDTYFYHQDGNLLHSESIGWVSWGQTENHIRAGSYLWNEEGSISVYISHTQTGTVAQVDFTDGTHPTEWPLDVSSYPYGVVGILDWVPQMDWVLLGYANGGVATHLATGYRLMALNVRSGEIVDSGLYTPGIEQIDWHPLEPGLLVTTDLQSSEVIGLGKLVLWQVTENQVITPSTTTEFVQSPVWSPDGRYLAYSDYDLLGNISLSVLDTETGQTQIRARNGTWPAWSRDSSMLFYLETTPESNTALIRAVSQEQGEPLTIAIGLFPSCPGSCQPRTTFDYAP